MDLFSNRTLSRAVFMGAVALGLIGTGCANLHSISRHTDIPAGTGARAIHLDAQQRLVVFTANQYCAEPSPDALAAYAAAIGVSGNTKGGNGGAASAAASTAVASMGLRTQSITLLRDSLYRTCEAAANGDLEAPQVAVLLTRSQHLSAVIMAIEQLTGAVTIGPTSTGGSANANAAAVLLANAQAVEAAKRMEAEAKTAADEAAKAEADAKTAETEAQGALAAAQKILDDAQAASEAPDQIAAKQARVEEKKVEAKAAADALADAKKTTASTKNQLASATELRRQIESARDNAILTTSAGTVSNSQLGTVSRTAPYPNDGKEIAQTVENMVAKLLDKDYAEDTCLIYLTNAKYSERAEQIANSTRSVGGQAPLAVTQATVELDARRGIVNYCLKKLGQQESRAAY